MALKKMLQGGDAEQEHGEEAREPVKARAIKGQDLLRRRAWSRVWTG